VVNAPIQSVMTTFRNFIEVLAVAARSSWASWLLLWWL